jgi:hypothetical protein
MNKVKHNVKLEGYKSLIQVMVEMHASLQAQPTEAQESELLVKKIVSIIKQIEQYIEDTRLTEDQSEEAR